MRNISIPSFDEVHIWSACLTENASDIPYFFSLLSEDEQKKVSNLRFTKDKNKFIISRGILRCLLERYLKEDPKCIEFLYGLWGKPCLSPEYSLCFNLSHSKDHALYAFALSNEVGIDLEYIDSTLDVDGLALTILSPQEQACWKTVDPEDKISIFFKLWVYKEAFLKASGKGWLSHAQELPLSILENICYTSNVNLEGAKMTLPYYFEAIPGYASALHVERSYIRPFHFTWSL